MEVTLFTTTGNRHFIANSLADTSVSIIEISFPQTVPEILPGVESTDALSSMTLFYPFCKATKLMQAEFEKKLEVLVQVQPVSFMVSDGFLWWTLESASKFGFPRLVFMGMNQFSSSVTRAVAEDGLFDRVESDDELFTVTQFPWIKVTRNDLNSTFLERNDLSKEVFMDLFKSISNSYGQIVNTFYELEKVYIDHTNSKGSQKTWCVGPLCLAEPESPEPQKKPFWIDWLDEKLAQGCSVLYVAFGSQAEISPEQLQQIATGLQESKANFLWVIRKKESESMDTEGLEERVKGRGMVVKQWVDQRQILKHQSIQGFLSHCGWNSALESMCYGVPILAWPMLAEQPLNARMVVEEIKVGLRVESGRNGMKPGFVKWQVLMKMVMELMEGERGKQVRKRVKEVAEMAKMAMEENSGSSWKTLNLLIDEICNKEQHVRH
ncbi:UDP-glycosyltransferase 90A2 [Hibiscus syriacus]|uniref:Glycosyltransferase n=1 Tax=Hibiscus syriacus TaxID=106335 RepID=A0A6A2ZCJ8_HIBSY|nr:UDP-glycosyltransferase 90A2 [Hibiscus syriacus]